LSGAGRPEPPPDPPAGDATAPDSIARNTGFALGVKLTGALFTAGLTLFLVRALGPDDYGVFALALSVGTLILLPSNLGISGATARFIAERRGDASAVSAVVADALRLKIAISAFFSLALVALAGPIADAYGASGLAAPLRILAVALFGQSLLLLYDSVFESLGRVSIYLRVVAVESAAETGASITFVLLGGGAAGAMLGRAAGYAVAGGLGLGLLLRTLGRRILPRVGTSQGHMRKIAGYGSALLVIDGAFTLFSRIDVLLIGAIISVPAVAQFEAPLRLVNFLGYAGLAANTGVAPRVARGAGEPDRAAFESALRYLMLLQGLFLAPLVVWAEPLTELALGPGFEESAEVLRWLAPFTFLLGISPLLAGAVNYLGEARRRVPIAIGALLVNLVIDLALLSEIGVVAGAIGTDVAYTLYVVAHLWICRRLLGTPLRPLLVTLGRTLLAGAVMAAVLLAFGTSEVSVPILLAGGALGAIAYAATLVAIRELQTSELVRVRDRARALLRRPLR
jgi:O-antigen/teichoic acid export membrane protein